MESTKINANTSLARLSRARKGDASSPGYIRDNQHNFFHARGFHVWPSTFMFCQRTSSILDVSPLLRKYEALKYEAVFLSFDSSTISGEWHIPYLQNKCFHEQDMATNQQDRKKDIKRQIPKGKVFVKFQWLVIVTMKTCIYYQNKSSLNGGMREKTCPFNLPCCPSFLWMILRDSQRNSPVVVRSHTLQSTLPGQQHTFSISWEALSLFSNPLQASVACQSRNLH